MFKINVLLYIYFNIKSVLLATLKRGPHALNLLFYNILFADCDKNIVFLR